MATLNNLARDERSARILLSLIGIPNKESTGRVLSRIGAVELIGLAESSTEIPGMDRVEAAVWRDHFHAHGSVDRLTALMSESHRFRSLIPGDAEWPQAVNDLGERAPYVLWAKGDAALLARDSRERVTIAGARAATAYGVHVTEEITDALVRADRVIVAGGAYGIEASAHKAALARNGTTIAVLASGLDCPYPAGHTELIDRIANQGLVITEVPPGHAPTRWGVMIVVDSETLSLKERTKCLHHDPNASSRTSSKPTRYVWSPSLASPVRRTQEISV